MRVNARGGEGRQAEEFRRTNALPRGLEEQGEIRRLLLHAIPEALHQHIRDRLAHRNATRDAHRFVESVVVDVVRETIAKSQGAIRVFPFVHEPDERVLALETFEALLDLLVGERQRPRQNGRVEADALYAGGAEQLAIPGVERVDLPLHETANRFGKAALQLRQAGRQDPASLVLHHHPAAAQVAKRVGHEERMSLGTPMNDLREVLRERVARELKHEIASDCRLVERSRPQLTAHAARDEIELQRQEGVTGLRKVRGTRGSRGRSCRQPSPWRYGDPCRRRPFRKS